MDDELPEPPPPAKPPAPAQPARAPSPAAAAQPQRKAGPPGEEPVQQQQGKVVNSPPKPNASPPPAQSAAPPPEPPMDRDRLMRTLYDYHGRQIPSAQLTRLAVAIQALSADGPKAPQTVQQKRTFVDDWWKANGQGYVPPPMPVDIPEDYGDQDAMLNSFSSGGNVANSPRPQFQQFQPQPPSRPPPPPPQYDQPMSPQSVPPPSSALVLEVKRAYTAGATEQQLHALAAAVAVSTSMPLPPGGPGVWAEFVLDYFNWSRYAMEPRPPALPRPKTGAGSGGLGMGGMEAELRDTVSQQQEALQRQQMQLQQMQSQMAQQQQLANQQMQQMQQQQSMFMASPPMMGRSASADPQMMGGGGMGGGGMGTFPPTGGFGGGNAFPPSPPSPQMPPPPMPPPQMPPPSSKPARGFGGSPSGGGDR